MPNSDRPLRPAMQGTGRKAWHALQALRVVQELGVKPPEGLSQSEAERRRERHGPNLLPEGRRRGPLRMFAAQFSDFMIIVLIAAAVVAGAVGEAADSAAILVIVVLNAIIGFVQEYRAERAMAALRRLSAPHARVRRDGRWHELDAAELVPGDIVELEAGDLVPADIRLLATAALAADESTLTGESTPVHKDAEAELAPDTVLADQVDMARRGTTIVHGRATGVVVETGAGTELGRIAGLLAAQEAGATPLQRRLADYGRRLAWAVLALCAVLFVAGLAGGGEPTVMFLTAVSLAVAAIPEALPAVVTLGLAFGARRMARHAALVRRLPAVETLGSVTTICSDKTGTLTLNRMRLEQAWVRPDADERAFWRAAALNSDCSLDASGAWLGDPTEVALVEAAQRAGQEREVLLEAMPRVAELPFDSERKRMTTIHTVANGGIGAGVTGDRIAFIKGAPEVVLSRCAEVPAEARAQAQRMADAGLRLIAFAMRLLPDPIDVHAGDAVERDMQLLGIAGLMDPPRDEARAAVEECRTAGIVPVMITGDHPATATAIARQLGILEPAERLDEAAQVITGRELAALDDATFAARVEGIRVYARVDPEQKIRVVSALKARGQFVAMTGDGVNDAPALRQADIGVAMGRGGTDVAREAASLVLLDDNFATIVRAVREGRRIYDNIRKFIRYTMSSNSGEIWALVLAPLMGLPVPLAPIHILWINLVTDGLPGLALASEPSEPGTMRRPPRPPAESFFAHGLWQHVIWVGLLMGGICTFLFWFAQDGEPGRATTMVFVSLTLCQVFGAMCNRSERQSLFSMRFFGNRALLLALASTILLQLLVVYLPALNPIFRTVPLDAADLLLCFALSGLVLVAIEIEKLLARRGLIYRVAS